MIALYTIIAFGYLTCLVGLYRYQSSSFRVHITSAASLIICWAMFLLALFNSQDSWIAYGVFIWALIQTCIAPMVSQMWRSIEEDQ